ncbi:hypothetical protein DZG00_09690 [Clavibacter lycopersici]|uniref:Uncharacterized protein n=1 Tax=Clavibacter lycopersici TaxID=2301718 RepID=A0A399T638_9MICO|nr:hypothetical protein [Clavibacter lycopersici]RIJ51238.1 hypothetical protein DZG00_09690 [Clavibacter lycopersici]RIJ57158.1 hypothetical protein DZG02_14740 [Clavibacter lycopersici]
MDITTSIRIDGHPFQLADGQDVADLKSRIVAAVTGGSRFVDFATVGQGEVSVLMTPRSAVRFEVLDRTEDEPACGDEQPACADPDLYTYR